MDANHGPPLTVVPLDRQMMPAQSVSASVAVGPDGAYYGFTSIVDLTFAPDGTLYVVEIDEASWAAVEFGVGSLGGTVNACNSNTWVCSAVATGLSMPVGAAVDRHAGEVYITINTLIPGAARVIKLD